MSPRKAQRFAVQFPTTFSGGRWSGDGTIVNLSREGCAVLSKENPPVSTYLTVRVDLSDDAKPLVIDLAAVRWRAEGRFGLEFIRMGLAEQERLRRVVADLEVDVNG